MLVAEDESAAVFAQIWRFRTMADFWNYFLTICLDIPVFGN
jgi:hypothetical protein